MLVWQETHVSPFLAWALVVNSFQIGTLQVTTGAAVFAVGGGGKTFQVYFVTMTSQTILRVVGHFVHSGMEYAG
jgi:hypothetical protein